MPPAMQAWVSASPPEPDRVADRLLDPFRLQKADDRLGHAPRAGGIGEVPLPDRCEASIQAVAEARGDLFSDLFFFRPVAGEEHGKGHGLGPLDSLGVVVGHGRASLRLGQHRLHGVGGIPDRGDPHGDPFPMLQYGPASSRNAQRRKLGPYPRSGWARAKRR